MAKNANRLTADFEFERATKNTLRFAEVVSEDEAPKVGTLYVQKHAFDGMAPTSLKLTLEFEAPS